MATYATTKVIAAPGAHSALVLGKENCGLVQQITGGSLYADVVEERPHPGQPVMKHIGCLRYEPFEMHVGFTMAKPLFGWIAASWKGTAPRMSGSVLACTEKLQVKAERQFHDAMITETVIPALDKASKEPVWLKVKFAPESTEYKSASGEVKAASPRNPEKLLAADSFRLEIAGLDCGKVQKIDALTFRQEHVAEPVGERRDYAMVGGVVRFSDVHLTFAEVSADPWAQWFDDFVVKGNCGQDKEKSGKLTLLSANQQTLAVVHLYQLGIYRMGAMDPAPGEDRLKLVTASLYCERMELEHS